MVLRLERHSFLPERQRETRIQGRQTVAKLIEIGGDELNRKGLSKFDLERVIKRARVSKGSFYHHFGSKTGFIAAVETEQFRQYLDGSNQQLRQAVETCTNASDFLSIIEFAIALSGLPDNRQLRQKRIRAMVFAQHNAQLAKLIRDNSIEVAKYLADTLQVAKDRGWIKPETNLLAVSYLLQGLFLGHLMLDVTDITDLDDAWNSAAVTALKAFLVI